MALDTYRLEKNPQKAMDIVAGRLRALVHYDLTKSWRVSEMMQAAPSRDIGLADHEDLWRAKRMARLTGAGSSSSSGGSPSKEDKEEVPKKKKKNKGKRNRKRGKKKKDEEEKKPS